MIHEQVYIYTVSFPDFPPLRRERIRCTPSDFCGNQNVVIGMAMHWQYLTGKVCHYSAVSHDNHMSTTWHELCQKYNPKITCREVHQALSLLEGGIWEQDLHTHTFRDTMQNWLLCAKALSNRPFARKTRGMHTYVTSHPEYTACPWIMYWNSPAARCLAALALGSYHIYL